MDQNWIEHRRSPDGELLGWLRASGDGFLVIDLLGRARTDTVDWLTAEEALDALGIGYLADLYELRLDTGQWLRVRIIEVSAERILVKKDDWGAIDVPQLTFTLAFPASDELRAIA